jgi:hypothetical protein
VCVLMCLWCRKMEQNLNEKREVEWRMRLKGFNNSHSYLFIEIREN